MMKWSSANLLNLYPRFKPLIEALGIERYLEIYYPETVSASIAMVFTELINILPYNDYDEKPIDLYRKWVNNKLLIVQLDEEENIIYNYDITTFIEQKNMDEECEIYFINHEGKFRNRLTDTRAAIIVEYILTEVNKMATDNLLEFLNDFQKFALKIKIQQFLDTMVKDERVHEVIDADKVFDYYNKMHEEFTKNPHNFLFQNREWLQDSLKRLNIDVSEIFDAGANVDHIKREEIIVLFILLWIHMKIQDPDSSSDVKTPYDLFIMWIYDRVFIAKPTDIDGAYNKAHGSVTKLRSNFKGFSFGRSDKNSVRYMMNWAQDRTDKLLTELADNFLEEKHRSRNIARNTKFVVREMTGMSNKDYKAFLKKFKEKEVMRYDETSLCFEDILKISSLEFDHEVILEAVDVYNRNVYHLNKALLKLKEKLNEG